MAKSMALIENGAIPNMLWCSDSEPETDILLDPAGLPVAIGDTTAMVNSTGMGWKFSPRWKRR